MFFSDGRSIASSINSKHCADTIFGKAGTAYLRYSLAVSPSVNSVFFPLWSVHLYMSSDDFIYFLYVKLTNITKMKGTVSPIAKG